MTSLSLPSAPDRWPSHFGNGSRDRSPPFWILQLLWWSAYGFLLMVPWLGRYPVLLMIPNKLIVGGTGLLVTSGLRPFYASAVSRGVPAHALLVRVALGSAVGGVLWSVGTVLLLGGRVGDQLVHLGTIGSGVPALAGASYHALIIALWSLVYVSTTAGRRHIGSRSGRNGSISTIVKAAPRTRDVLIRDGKRTIVLSVGEIDWIQAEGDYVRVHLGQRSLLVRDTMSRIDADLAGELLRIHRSTIVNVGRVRETHALPNRELEVVLQNGVRLRASRTYADRLRAALAPLDGTAE